MKTLVLDATTVLILAAGGVPVVAQTPAFGLPPTVLEVPAQTPAEVQPFQFEGNTVLTDAALAAAVADFAGEAASDAALSEIANEVVGFYRARGYHCRVEASADGGVVTLQITESRLGDLTITGLKRFSDGYIRKYFSDLKPGEVWSERDLDTALRIVQELQGMSYAYSVLSAGAEPGTTDIEVTAIESAAFSAAVEFDNFGSSYASRERLSERVRYDNPTGRGDAVALQVVHGLDPGDVLFGHLSYEFPITSRGTKLNAYVSAGDFEVGRDLALLGLSGESIAYGIGATHPLKRSRARSITAALGFDSADADFGMNLNTTCGGIIAQDLSKDRIRKLRAGIAIDDRDKGGEARNLLNVYVHQGLGGFLGGSENDAITSRAGADNSFTKFTVDFTRLQRLDDESYFAIKLSSQHSLDGLFSGEQFAIGGPDSVRGYPQSETLGDSGLIVSAEYRRSLKEAPRDDPEELRRRWLHDLQGVAFIDYGRADLKNPASGEQAGRDLTGMGVGFRANLKHDTFVRTDLGFALGDRPSVGGRFQPYVKVTKTF